jgi:hypothetical protein
VDLKQMRENVTWWNVGLKKNIIIFYYARSFSDPSGSIASSSSLALYRLYGATTIFFFARATCNHKEWGGGM